MMTHALWPSRLKLAQSMENALKITISIFHFIKLQFYRLFEQLQNVRSPPSS